MHLGEIDSVEDHVLLGSAELRVALYDLVDGVHEVFLSDGLSSRADGEHTRLCAHTADVRTCRVRAHSCYQFETNVLVKCHSLSVNLENLYTALEVRQPKLDFAIKTARTGESRV